MKAGKSSTSLRNKLPDRWIRPSPCLLGRVVGSLLLGTFNIKLCKALEKSFRSQYCMDLVAEGAGWDQRGIHET